MLHIHVPSGEGRCGKAAPWIHRCSVQDARFIKSLSLPIYISIDGSFFYTQELSAKGRRSCSCTTCIVYVNLFKDRFFLIVASFRKADAKVRTFSYTLQMFLKFFFIFFFPVSPESRPVTLLSKGGGFQGERTLPPFLSQNVNLSLLSFQKRVQR